MTENQNIEWKEVWKDEYLKWICGFANAKGGRLYIGKRDDSAWIFWTILTPKYRNKC